MFFETKQVSYLEQRLKEGYLLHGTQCGEIRELEPRKARCESQRIEGTQCAVYASASSVLVPSVMALFFGKGRSSYHGDDGVHLLVEGTRSLKPGWIYVLPPETFINFRGEWISYKPVRPVESLLVTPTILRVFLRRKTLDLRVPIPAPW